MDRSYLQSFNDEQLLNYKNTLKRRIKDLRELLVQLTAENQDLGHTYEQLIHQKTHVYHQIEKKKKSWGNWLNKGKEKLGNFLHITKKSDANEFTKEQNKGQKSKQEQHNYVSPEKQQDKKEVTPPKNKVMNILQKGKEKITQLFSSTKNTSEEEKFDLQYDAPEKRFGYLSEMVKQNTFHPQSKYSQILQKMEEKNIRFDNSHAKRDHFKSELPHEAEKEKKQLSSFEKITKHELHQSQSKQNCTIKVQTTAFQPLLTEEDKNDPQPQEKIKTQEEAKSLKSEQNEETKEKDVIEKNSQTIQKQDSSVIQEKVKKVEVEENHSRKQEDRIEPAEQDQENQYEVHYDNYQLEQGALSQIVEKYAPSHQEIQLPLPVASQKKQSDLSLKKQSGSSSTS